MGRVKLGTLVICAALVLGVVGPGVARAGIPSVPPPTGPAFTGAAAVSHPVWYPAPPRNRFMAPNGRSNIHDDGYMSNTYEGPGPLGVRISVTSLGLAMDCASVTFDAQGRIVSVCVGVAGPKLYLIDPHSLNVLATFSLPPRNLLSVKNVNPFQDFGGGGYFYLDAAGRAVIPTTSRHIWVVGETSAGSPGFRLVRDYDLSGVVPSGDEITSVLPDSHGLLWFVTFDGLVGTVSPASGAVHVVNTHEETENSFAVGSDGGVFVVSDRAMYRWDAGSSGVPRVTWRVVYPNSGIHKPGQVDAGSGTTPTLMGSKYVAIADNADPMDVVVLRRSRRVRGTRFVCVHPVFARGASDTENSLIGTARSIVVENNYGYTGPAVTENGGSTTPGLWRVDVNRSGRGCHTVWRSSETAPTVVPKLSLSNGLVYTYVKPPAESDDSWYLAALSFASGRTVYRQLAGDGLGYNNNYAPVTLGPDGTAYVGALGGLIEFRDAVRPPFLHARPPRVARHRRRRRHSR